MYKYIILIALAFSACANFTINSTMCDQVAREPGVTMPQECRDYNEKDADKAFHKVVEEKKVSDKDIKFDKEENE
ncbi:hypothetical protein MNB_SM-4-379 [hydrothermal vent metagenome]|uniref:Lipoprotein n=1 Tax=hydrothermal vent metagenome TaxID=652676 RepID=A0A1W1BJH0_9ZZZZ